MVKRQLLITIDVDKLHVDIQTVFDKYRVIKYCAYVIHNDDETRQHYHIHLYFLNKAVNIQQVAKWFNLGYTDEQGNVHDGTQFINIVKCHWTAVSQYLTHGKGRLNILTR